MRHANRIEIQLQSTNYALQTELKKQDIYLSVKFLAETSRGFPHLYIQGEKVAKLSHLTEHRFKEQLAWPSNAAATLSTGVEGEEREGSVKQM